jgi:hypothetical protein
MPDNQSPAEGRGSIISKLSNPNNPPILKLTIFVTVLVLGTILVWLFAWLLAV